MELSIFCTSGRNETTVADCCHLVACDRSNKYKQVSEERTGAMVSSLFSCNQGVFCLSMCREFLASNAKSMQVFTILLCQWFSTRKVLFLRVLPCTQSVFFLELPALCKISHSVFVRPSCGLAADVVEHLNLTCLLRCVHYLVVTF